MAAANTDKFTKVGNPGTATTLDAPGHTIAGTSLTVISTTNWPTDTGVIFAMDTVSSTTGLRDAGSYTEWEGIVSSGTTIGSLVLRYGTDQNYPAGATSRVYIPVASSRENRMVDGILVEHNQDGTHASGIALTSPVLTTPKVITSVKDTNGNELLKVTATASAVNELTLANAAAGGTPTLSATGDDTNIHLALTTKGNGLVKNSVLRQDDTTNTYQHGNTVTLNGYGYIAGSGGSFLSDNISFGITFTSAPVVTVSVAGFNTSSGTTYPPSSATGAACIEVYNIATTGFTVRLGKFPITGFDTGNVFPVGNNYFYTWTAEGQI